MRFFVRSKRLLLTAFVIFFFLIACSSSSDSGGGSDSREVTPHKFRESLDDFNAALDNTFVDMNMLISSIRLMEDHLEESDDDYIDSIVNDFVDDTDWLLDSIEALASADADIQMALAAEREASSNGTGIVTDRLYEFARFCENKSDELIQAQNRRDQAKEDIINDVSGGDARYEAALGEMAGIGSAVAAELASHIMTQLWNANINPADGADVAFENNFQRPFREGQYVISATEACGQGDLREGCIIGFGRTDAAGRARIAGSSATRIVVGGGDISRVVIGNVRVQPGAEKEIVREEVLIGEATAEVIAANDAGDYDPSPPPPSSGAYTLTASGDQSGQEVDGSVVISRQYDLAVSEPALSDENIFVELPVNPAYLDDFSEDDLITVEYFDEQGGEWISLPVMSYFDPEENIIHFELPVTMASSLDGYSLAPQPLQARSQVAMQPTAAPALVLRATRVASWNPKWVRLPFRDTPFVIHYQSILGRDRPVSDEEWRGTGKTYRDDEGMDIPSYIGDLHKALDEVYTSLLTLVDGNGNRIFNEENRIVVYVKKMGAAGQAQLGGRMEFNVQMDDYNEMRRVVAHEMVHILQGQHYTARGLFTGRENRWFIEATAQYFGQLVIGLTGTERKDFLLGDDYSSYLSVPINTNTDSSYYAAGHFLSWLSRTYSTTLVQDTLRASRANDLNALSRTLEDAGCPGGINEAYEEYVAYVMTHPEADADISQNIKARMMEYNQDRDSFNFSIPLFSPDRTYLTFTTTVPHLAARYVALRNTQGNPVSRSSLLVIESETPTPELKRMSYDFIGTRNSEYAGTASIDKNHDYATGPLTVEDFGRGQRFEAFEQMFVNTADRAVGVEMTYYLLIAPEIKEIQNGAVLWDTSSVGNIPLEHIEGYNVYRDATRLNDALVSFQPGSQSFAHDGITTDSDITVQIVDKYDNRWPKMADRDVSLTITPGEVLDGRVDEQYSFELEAQNIPGDVLYVYFDYDFGDLQTHGKGRSSSVEVVAGRAKLDLSYTYRADRFYSGRPEATITVIVMDAFEEVELARATAEMAFYNVVIQGERSITYTLPDDGRADTTLDFEAIATPEGVYAFVWNFGDGSPEVTDTVQQGASSQVSQDYTGLKDGDEFRPTVRLRDPDGNWLAEDTVVIYFQRDDEDEIIDCGWEVPYSQLSRRESDDGRTVYYTNSAGALHGPYIQYRSDGQISIYTCYYNQVEHGYIVSYNMDGVQTAQWNNYHGKQHGLSLYYDRWDDRCLWQEYEYDEKVGQGSYPGTCNW